MDSNTGNKAGLTRREIVIAAGSGLALAALGGPAAAAATRISATAQRKCATCEFWGGSRTVSADRKWVEASGTGTCNNPASPAYRKKTRPDQGAPVWQRWSRLG
ncbi:hypothetical protein [Polymorphum gilvum]|uniref:Uncharacterized protein n=1 Tax=Polymorphum gilvum (strain LMG 25793 / CGMCC 1.9160 / SL003B-26A1) TaxID=991905 RepID=F2IYG8_POLGS|nr:hypothetical protein [Polymorphum gilvum]ADZ68481.1 hypothetical protein SL003B_0042 [Polymorphum gilvum SL003B-26A1]